MRKKYEIFTYSYGKAKLNASTNSKAAATRIFNQLLNSSTWLPCMEKVILTDTEAKSVLKEWTK